MHAPLEGNERRRVVLIGGAEKGERSRATTVSTTRLGKRLRGKNGATIVKSIVLFVSLLYLSLVVPLGIIIFTPYWHQVYSRWNPRIERVGMAKAAEGIRELSAFFRHTRELSASRWTEKEKQHLGEVRMLVDKLVVLAAFGLIGLVLTRDRRRMPRFALINIIVMISALMILPFFAQFWRQVFHPLFFDNHMWMNTPRDFSFWIMPRSYFRATTALLIVTSVMINMGVWIGLKKTESVRNR